MKTTIKALIVTALLTPIVGYSQSFVDIDSQTRALHRTIMVYEDSDKEYPALICDSLANVAIQFIYYDTIRSINDQLDILNILLLNQSQSSKILRSKVLNLCKVDTGFISSNYLKILPLMICHYCTDTALYSEVLQSQLGLDDNENMLNPVYRELIKSIEQQMLSGKTPTKTDLIHLGFYKKTRLYIENKYL